MSAGSIEVGGKSYASLADVVAKRRTVAEELKTLFAGYTPDGIEALHPHEPRIVSLFNDYQRLSETIERETELHTRNQNIEAAWRLVCELRKDTSI